MLTAAILAGGHARRLGGRDKSALPIDGVSILARQLAAIAAVTPHVMLVGGGEAPDAAAGVPVVPDRLPGAGALGGLYTALIEARGDQVLVVACDMPFLTAAFLEHLAAAGRDVDAAVPRDDSGMHPLCASYARSAAPRLRAAIERGSLGVIDAVSSLDPRIIGPDELARFDPDGRLLLNVNTPADYERARGPAPAGRRQS
jgi:molybdopterin-guanine dinucleotide biosynthesis protein A